jgi:hypothetical protein
VLQRSSNISALNASPNAAPSMDLGGHGIQDPRMPWNTGNSSAGAQAIGWYISGPHPVIDYVPSTLSSVAIAAAQVPVAGTPLVLVSSTGGGITVAAAAQFVLPSLNTVPSGSLLIDTAPAVIRYGSSDYTVFYDPATIVGRNIQILSVGDDHLATFTVAGYDTYGYPLHETITGSSGAPGTAVGKKAFKWVTSVTPAGTLSGSNVSVGQGDTYGLPMLLNSIWSLTGFWNNLLVTGAGTPVIADTTAVATATTGDVRGTYLVGSASNGPKRLQLFMHPSLSQMVSLGMVQGIVGVTPF